MPEYTTGELAKSCGVTVRTVQYYDNRGILCPSAFSEGGRRLYSESDRELLGIICFLRELGLPLDSIAGLLKEEKPEEVIELLLDRQEAQLRDELAERREKLDKLEQLRRGLRSVEVADTRAIGDIAQIMSSKKQLRSVRLRLLLLGLLADVLEWVSVLLWIFSGVWWPFAVCMPLALALSIYVSGYYYNNVHYICPSCHSVFKPRFRDVLTARHTVNTRRLTCTACGHHGFCVETYRKE